MSNNNILEAFKNCHSESEFIALVSKSEAVKQFYSLAKSALEGGVRLKHFKKVTSSEMRVMYASAYAAYNSGQYEESILLFHKLFLLDHLDPKYIKGLAASNLKAKHYQEAIENYLYAAGIDDQDPSILFHLGYCHMMLGENSMAKRVFQEWLDKFKGKNIDVDMVSRVKFLLKKSDKDDNNDGE